MRDVNYPCQKSYLLALTGITFQSNNIPVFYQMIPDNIAPSNYVIFGPVSNNDASTMTSADTFTSMRVTIHTFSEKYNTGKAAAFIGGEILTRIYPTPQFVLDLSADNLQCVSTEMVQDLTQDYSNLTSRVYIDRIFIFRHRIYHRSNYDS